MRFEKRKRRLINSQLPHYKLEKVDSVEDVVKLNQTMLEPYAFARWGKGSYNFPLEKLIEMAFTTGQLNLLMHDGKQVGCIIGHFSNRNHQRYWQSDRMGFTEFIFNDMQRYRETNVMITHLQIQWAIAQGADYYDMGHNPAWAETGIVYHKRTFGGELSDMGNNEYIYLKLPSSCSAKFYWNKPLFALEGKVVVLHLGLPDNTSDTDLLNRYKLLNFNGLGKVYLHYETARSESAIKIVADIYSHLESPPKVVAIGVTD